MRSRNRNEEARKWNIHEREKIKKLEERRNKPAHRKTKTRREENDVKD